MEEFADADFRDGRSTEPRRGGERYDDRRDSATTTTPARPTEMPAPTTAPPVWPPVQTPQLAGGPPSATTPAHPARRRPRCRARST